MAERADALATMAVCGVAPRSFDLEGDSATQKTAVADVFYLRNWLAAVVSISNARLPLAAAIARQNGERLWWKKRPTV